MSDILKIGSDILNSGLGRCTENKNRRVCLYLGKMLDIFILTQNADHICLAAYSSFDVCFCQLCFTIELLVNF